MVLDPNVHHINYRMHRQRVLNAKSLVDSQPPSRRLKDFVPPKEVSYLEMLATMKNDIRMCKSQVRTFTRSPEAVKERTRLALSKDPLGRFSRSKSYGSIGTFYQPFQLLSQPQTQLQAQPQQQQQQQQLQQYQQPVEYQDYQMSERHPHLKHPHHQRKRKQTDDSRRKEKEIKKKLEKESVKIPDQVLKRFEHLTVQKDFGMLRKLLRPRVYMDLEVKDIRPLGRIIIQLFTEACPEVVLEFLRACACQSKERFSFTRLFPPIWLEGELMLEDNVSLTSSGIDHDLNVIDHGVGAGILSFPCRYVRGSKRRSVSFTMSFKPIKVLNGKRIAFGRVRRGFWILDTIQDFGTKNGKPLKEIIVAKCGVLK